MKPPVMWNPQSRVDESFPMLSTARAHSHRFAAPLIPENVPLFQELTIPILAEWVPRRA